MKLRSIALIAVVSFALLILVPFLIPMGRYISQAEQLASEKARVPVKIKSLHVAVLPSPRIHIGGIQVGQGAFSVERLSAVLDIGALLTGQIVASSVEVDRPIIRPAAMDIFSGLASQEPRSANEPFPLRRILVKEAKVAWPDISLPAMNAEIELSEDAQIRIARFDSVDHVLAMEVVSDADGFSADLTAKSWILPAGPPLKIDQLKAKLKFSDQSMNLEHLQADLYRGKIEMAGTLDWKKLWHLNGNIKADGLEVGEVSRVVTPSPRLSGRVSGSGTFGSSAKSPGSLADNLNLIFNYNVSNGTLHGFDLAKVASLFIKQDGKSGETQFDHLSGVLQLKGKEIELRKINVASGLLAANGNVKISPLKKLDGMLDVELKKGLALVTVPLKVSGSVEAPEIMPTKAAIAGAAAGTAILGPMGTSIGMKAGAAIDKLFGGGKK